jgi:hypothetical protein
MLYILSALYLAGLVRLIVVTYTRRWQSQYLVVKTTLSIGFVLVATCTAIVQQHVMQPFFLCIIPCFMLCLLGDWALGVANMKRQFFSQWFKRGAAAFTLAHVGFCLSFSLLPPRAPWHWWDAALPCVMFLSTLACVQHPGFKLRRMKLSGIALVYSLFVGLMCARSISFGLSRGFNQQGIFVALGGVLFLLSDTVLMFSTFYVRPRRALHAINLVTYYLGMLLLALAV